MSQRLTVLTLMLCLYGCSFVQTSSNIERDESIPMAAPIDPPRHIVQQLSAYWSNRQETLLCVLELDKKHIAIAGLSIDGISLFNLSYDGKTISLDKSPLLPDTFSPEFIIKDLQLVYWPLNLLQKLLPRQWHLTADNTHRRLYFNNELLTEVDYVKPDAQWAKAVIVTNYRYHYSLNIKTISYETLSE